MCALVRGVFTKKPAKIYLYMGCLSCFRFCQNKWGNSNSLSDRDLTFTLVMMLTLISSSRSCTIHCLDIRFMARHVHFAQFLLGKLHKGWKSGKSSPVVRNLCIQMTLDVYLERTKPWRTDQKKQLLLSYVNPK